MSKRLARFDLRFSGLIAFVMVLLSAILLLDITTTLAQIQPVVPKGGKGYTVSISQDWAGGFSGFRPVRVTVATNPAKAAAKDERFEIQARSRQYGTQERITSGELIIPAGQKSGTAEIYVNEVNSYNTYDNRILVKDGGRVICQVPGHSQGNTAVSHPSILLISDEFPAREVKQSVCYKGKSKTLAGKPVTFNFKSNLPSVEVLCASVYQTGYGGGGTGKAASLQSLKIESGLHYSSFADLPYSWIGLQGTDIILVSLDQLKSLTKANELQRSNLEKWLSAGGTLVVYGTGPKFKKANQIWPALLGADREFIAEGKNKLWRVPSSKIAELSGPIFPEGHPSSNDYRFDRSTWAFPPNYTETDIAVSKWKQYPNPRKFPKSTPFGICDCLDGAIVAVDSDMSKWKQKEWRLLHNSIVTHGRLLSQRVSGSAIGQTLSGTDFQIPGVGEPPVNSFQVLIGLFLLLAGPIMMIVLKRTKQMQYLFVAVPLLSAAVCSCLFLYAVVFEGSTRWGRCNSVTHLDHQTSTAVTHARATYYSGRHPGSYELPVDGLGVAFPGVSDPSQVDFKNGLMKLSGGKIHARIPHEVTSVRPYQTNNRLVVLPGKSGEEDAAQSKPGSDSDAKPKPDAKSAVAPRVQNRLGADVKWAMIRTEDGYFVVKDLPAGQTTDAAVSTLAAGVSVARSIANKLSPQRVGSSYRNRRYSSYYNNRNYGGILGDDYHFVGLLKSGELSELLSRPNSYVALMEDFPLAAEQLEPVQYKMQLHVVRGQW